MSFASEMIRAWAERDEYAAWAKAEREKRKPAVDIGIEECQQCGYCCARRTCVPLPDELQGIADHLGLTIPELIQRYMVGDEQLGRYFLRFANTAQTDVLGQFLDDWRTYDKGDCLLYDKIARICHIWAVRPADARETFCWNADGDYKSIQSWKDGDLERICPEMKIYDDWNDYEDDDDW